MAASSSHRFLVEISILAIVERTHTKFVEENDETRHRCHTDQSSFEF